MEWSEILTHRRTFHAVSPVFRGAAFTVGPGVGDRGGVIRCQVTLLRLSRSMVI